MMAESRMSLACSLLGNHKACRIMRVGIRHSHERKDHDTGNWYNIASHSCPTCACRCPCHDVTHVTNTQVTAKSDDHRVSMLRSSIATR